MLSEIDQRCRVSRVAVSGVHIKNSVLLCVGGQILGISS